MGARPLLSSPILAAVMVPGCRATADLTCTPVGCVQTVLVGPATWQAGVGVSGVTSRCPQGGVSSVASRCPRGGGGWV